MTTIVTRSAKGAPLSIAEGDANFTNLNDDKLELTDLSVTTGPTSGAGELTYDNLTGVFEFKPADLGTYVELNDLSVTSVAPSGGGSLSYDNTTGVFTFAPGDLSLAMSELADDNAPALGGNLDVGAFNIQTSTVNGDVAINANGSGAIVLGNTTTLGGNLDMATYDITTNTLNGDVTVRANGTGNVVLTGTNIEFAQPVLSFPNGGVSIEPATGNTVEIKGNTVLVGEATATEALITGAAGSNAALKLRGAGTGNIIMDDPVEISGGNLDMTSKEITTSTVNGNINITNNGIGATSINGGTGLVVNNGFIGTGTDTDMVLAPDGIGALVVVAPSAGLVIENTASSGYGSITGTADTGIVISADEGSQFDTDAIIKVNPNGGLILQAGSTSSATITANTVSITGATTFNSDVTFDTDTAVSMDLFTNWVHDLISETPTGVYAPDASTGNVKYIVPQGNLTINDFAAGSIVPGQSISMFIDQSSFGSSFTLTMGGNFLFPGGTAPALTPTGNDLITFTCLDDGTATGGNVYIGNIVNNYQ